MSWKTTLCGVIALVGTLLAQFWPDTMDHWGGFLAALGSGLGLIFARDNDKSSEDVGAHPVLPPGRPTGLPLR